MGLAWGVAFYLTQYLFEKNNLNSKSLAKIYFGIFISAWIGAKIFYLLFSSQEKTYQYLYADYFWLGGGFVFYGGLIFGLIHYFIYSYYLKLFDLEKSYLLLPGLVFGHAIGRIGCFLTGCCYGTHCDLPWAIKHDGEFRHPVQLYEAFALFLIGAILLKWIKDGRKNSFIVINYLLIYSFVRFGVEFFRGDDIRGIYWMSLSTSQLISLGLFLSAFLFRISSKFFSST